MRLVVDSLGLARGGRRLARGLSFALGPGEALAVTGPNGAGKSTLLRVIAGLLPAVEGGVALEPAEDADVATRAHYLGHANALKGALTARENLEFWATMLAPAGGGVKRLSAEAALDALGLAHAADLPCAYLSAGQKRRAALARLLTAPRPLWLLDEPAAALDTAAQARLEAVIRAHLAGGGLVIAALHAPLDIGPARELPLAGRA
jgi:heme exporter protein A